MNTKEQKLRYIIREELKLQLNEDNYALRRIIPTMGKVSIYNKYTNDPNDSTRYIKFNGKTIAEFKFNEDNETTKIINYSEKDLIDILDQVLTQHFKK